MASNTRISAVVAALLVTWIVWGSTFVAIHVAVQQLPPMLMMGSRFVVAGAVATMVGRWLAKRANAPLPGAAAWRDATIVGAGLVTVGMGATGWAATRLPTGIAALLVASAPLWVAALSTLALRVRISTVALVGLGVGIAGVGLLVLPTGGAHTAVDPLAALVIVGANAAWAASSLVAARRPSPHGLLLTCGMQMLTGGGLLVVAGATLGEFAQLDLRDISSHTALSWVYLVLVGALGGFLAYGWLLDRVSTSVASTHAFVNPLVAVSLGALLLGEHIGGRTLLAGAAVVAAVVLLLEGERRAAASSITPSAADSSRATSHKRAAAARVVPVRRMRGGRSGWRPTPTPAFAARRMPRPPCATDGMDALDIDEAFDSFA